MRTVFMDSGYLIALAKKRDPYHAKAREVSDRLAQEQARVVTTPLCSADASLEIFPRFLKLLAIRLGLC
ncbi:MAG: hypothetical protein SNJ66_11565 [Chloroherpetonaceae bacterium]